MKTIYRFKWLLAVQLLALANLPSRAEELLNANEAVQHALANNRELAAARVRVEEAMARLQQAGLRPNPEFELGGRFDAPFGNEGESSFAALLSQPFSVSGRIGAQKNVAQVEMDRAIIEIAEMERHTVADVRRTFSDFLALDEQIKLQKFLKGLNEELLTALKVALAQGQISGKDINAIQIALQQAQQREKLLETQRRSRLLELNRLMGRTAESDIAATGTLEFQPAPDLSAFTLDKALPRRPDIVAAQIDVELAKSQQRLVKTERFEDWRVGVGYEREQSVVDGAPAQRANNFVALRLSIPLPLFDRKQGRIRETVAREDRARKTVEALKVQVSEELADAAQRSKTLASLLESYTPEILKRAEDNVKLVENGYRQGQTSIVEVIQSRQQFAELKSSYFDTLRDYHLALIDLDIAAGIFSTTIKPKPSKEVKPNEKQ